MISIINPENQNLTMSAEDLRRIQTLARVDENCPYNQKVKEYYKNIMSWIITRARDGYTDFNINKDNRPEYMDPANTEPLRAVIKMLAELQYLDIVWYWDKNKSYTCKSIHINWDKNGHGEVKYVDN